jgi:hypothetical protein
VCPKTCPSGGKSLTRRCKKSHQTPTPAGSAPAYLLFCILPLTILARSCLRPVQRQDAGRLIPGSPDVLLVSQSRASAGGQSGCASAPRKDERTRVESVWRHGEKRGHPCDSFLTLVPVLGKSLLVWVHTVPRARQRDVPDRYSGDRKRSGMAGACSFLCGCMEHNLCQKSFPCQVGGCTGSSASSSGPDWSAHSKKHRWPVPQVPASQRYA